MAGRQSLLGQLEIIVRPRLGSGDQRGVKLGLVEIRRVTNLAGEQLDLQPSVSQHEEIFGALFCALNGLFIESPHVEQRCQPRGDL